MAASPRVELNFSGSRIEVAAAVAQRRGGLRAFVREAEQQLGLRPGTFGFYGTFGKVDSIDTLQRELRAAVSDGVCRLEIRESTEGKLMREMYAAMTQFEQRVLARVDDALANARQEMEPVMRDLADEQLRLRAKIDTVSEEALEARVDMLAGEEELSTRIDALTRDCLALKEQDLRASLDALTSDCLAMREDFLASEETLTKRLDELDASTKLATAASEAASALKNLEALEEQLERDMEMQAQQEELDAARQELDHASQISEVRALERKPLAVAEQPMHVATPVAVDSVVSATPAYLLDLDVPAQKDIRTSALKKDVGPFDGRSKANSLSNLGFKGAALQYSGKGKASLMVSPIENRWGYTDAYGKDVFCRSTEFGAPFAQPRLRACQSSPLLPPLR
eukprot:TRINITY_DN59589_c0_g1_i1.p1 TRINITY_DN59589_c0_g1~~TRINITY_DN59589_c0_g1_i1.p1  ORF type:complete len:422 (+),score=100.41 TRINITY_DN59589_c0_g1_i1:74-1267(+)